MTESAMQKLRTLALPHTDILEVTHEAGSYGGEEHLPPFVRVLWKNSFGEHSEIYTEMWLPDDWNGIFVALGNGGMAGGIHIPSIAAHARNGYAAVHTDMGTRGGYLRGVGEPDVWNDFGWRSTHMMAEVGRALVRAHYGRDADYSYFLGASTGGNQAMKMVQCFPDDYDGVLAGVPAHNRVFLHVYGLWMHNCLQTPDGVRLFSDEDVLHITEAAEAFFAARGIGEEGDGFVTYPYVGENTVDEFLSYLSAREPQFTEKQLSVLGDIYRGPVDPVTGRQIYNGMPIGAESNGAGLRDLQNPEPPFFDPFKWVFGADYDGQDFDFHRDVEIMSDALSAAMNANDPDLSPFASHGGRLIVYSAASDPCVPFPDAQNYWERVFGRMGGYAQVSQFARWFLAPGMDHGNGGRGVNALWADERGADLFSALRRWREEGIAPAYLIGARVTDGEVVLTRRMYPYGSDEFPVCGHVRTCDDYYLAK